MEDIKRQAKIYTLRDVNGSTRYVGQTRVSLPERLRKHLVAAATSKETNHRCNWLRKCIADGQPPTIHLLKNVEGTQAEIDEIEYLWIVILNKCGNRLTNAKGIDTCRVLGHSPETRAKISRGHRGKTISEEQKAILRACRIGVPMSPAAKQKLSKTITGRKLWTEDKKWKLHAAWKKRRELYGETGRA